VHGFDVGHADTEVARLTLVGIDHQRSAWTERAIGEDLQRTDADPVIAKALAQTQFQRVIDPGIVDVLDDTEVQLTTLSQELKRAQAVRPVEIVKTG
jgi:hypothetical protein